MDTRLAQAVALELLAGEHRVAALQGGTRPAVDFSTYLNKLALEALVRISWPTGGKLSLPECSPLADSPFRDAGSGGFKFQDPSTCWSP